MSANGFQTAIALANVLEWHDGDADAVRFDGEDLYMIPGSVSRSYWAEDAILTRTHGLDASDWVDGVSDADDEEDEGWTMYRIPGLPGYPDVFTVETMHGCYARVRVYSDEADAERVMYVEHAEHDLRGASADTLAQFMHNSGDEYYAEAARNIFMRALA